MHTCLHPAEENTEIIIIQEPCIGTNEEEKTFYTISHPSFDSLISYTENCPRTIISTPKPTNTYKFHYNQTSATT
jgi:hypothetical protein